MGKRETITVADRLNYPTLDRKWIIPEWMKKYEKNITGNGEPIVDLIRDYDVHGKNWAFSNIIKWAVCFGVHEQITLLYRLHREGKII